MKYKHHIPILLTFLSVCLFFSACNENEDNGVPEISYVRFVGPENADSSFTDVFPGKMIVVIGKNLTDIKRVLINEQEIRFNTNYGTPTNLILTIPSSLKLTGAYPDLKRGLVIETSHGIATYDLHVLSPAPYITRIKTTFPVETGTQVQIYGGNFYEIQRIYFTTAEDDITNAPVSNLVTDYTVNREFNVITFNAPAGLIEEGSLVVECYTDPAFTHFRKFALPPVLTGISSMMPITGTRVKLTGQNFMDITSIKMGDIMVDLSTVEISEANDTLTFTMPNAPQGTCSLALTTMGGTVEIPGFYPLENVVLNFDNIGRFSWGGKASEYKADGTKVPLYSDGKCRCISGEISTYNYWWGQIINNAVYEIPEEFLPAATPTSDLVLQFECFVAKEYGPGPVFRVYLKGNTGHAFTNYRPVSDFSGMTEVGQWMQCSIPLTAFTDEATWGDFLKLSNNGLAFEMTNPSGNGPYNVEFYFDNFRIVPKK